MQNISTTKQNNKTQVALAMSGHAVTDLYASFIIGVIPILAVKFNLSLFFVSLLTSITGISNSLTQPIFGYLADKYNSKYFLVFGPLFSAIFISVMPIMPKYYLLILTLFLGNLSVSLMHPPTAAIGGIFGGRFKGLSNSLISFSGTFGYSIGSIFIITVIEKLGLNFSPITMIPGVITAVILYKYLKLPNPKSKNNIISNINIYKKIKSISKIKIFRFSLIFAASFSRDILWIALTTFMPLHFSKTGINLINIGTILIIFTLVGGFGGILAGYFSDKMKNKTILIQIGLFLSVPLTFFMFKVNNFVSIILFIAVGFFSIGTLPLCIRVSQDIFPSNMSLASSLVMGLSVGSASVTMIFLGKVADFIGIQKTIEYLLILILFISLILFFYILNINSLKGKKLKKIF